MPTTESVSFHFTESWPFVDLDGTLVDTLRVVPPGIGIVHPLWNEIAAGRGQIHGWVPLDLHFRASLLFDVSAKFPPHG